MDTLQNWIEKSKKHAELIGSGKSNEDALLEVWGDEEAEKILNEIKKIENKFPFDEIQNHRSRL